MVQHRVMQYDDARFFQRPLVNFPMQRIVAQMVERDVGR